MALSRARDAESVKVATLRKDRRVKNPVIPAMIDEEDFNELGPMEIAMSSGEEPVLIERIPHEQVVFNNIYKLLINIDNYIVYCYYFTTANNIG